jgi:hypothetical protein
VGCDLCKLHIARAAKPLFAQLCLP